MNCIGPTTPEDFELLAYADGEASPEVVAHLSACAYCRSRAEELRKEVAIWQKALRRAGCPPALELGEHALRMLPAEREAGVSEHLRLCRACASELAMLKEFLARVEDARLEVGLAEAAGALRTLKARLTGAAGEAGAGLAAPLPRAVRELRGPYLDDTPPVTYNAEKFLVTLESWPEGNAPTRHLVGLVAGPTDYTGAEVELSGGGDAPRTVPVDDLGSFSLTGVSVGAHRLLVRLPTAGAQVEIEDFDVK